MRRKLKYYGGLSSLSGTQERVVAAVFSQAEFAKLIGASVKYVADYCCETGNEEEIKQAQSFAHRLHKQCYHCGSWQMLEVPK